MSNYIQPAERSLFDNAMRLEELHAMGDPLARLDAVIDWSVFTSVLQSIPRAEPKARGGRPAFDPAVMFKALIIQSLYQLSDRQLEFQITDRASFKRFLGFTEADKSPDEKTFWAFREMLVKNQLIRPLFDRFHTALDARGLFARQGQIVDATFVEVARQRNSREENAKIKAGEVPEEWKEQPQKLCQKDVEARWTKKREQTYYGYKNHVKVDSRSKLIDKYTVTDASVHDSQELDKLIEKGDPTTYIDSAYAGKANEQMFAEKNVTAKIIERAYRNKPLNGTQKRSNRAKSRTRVRVEHVFATMRMSMRVTWNRCIGWMRNTAGIGLTNLVYNMVRCEQIERLELKNWRAA